MQSGDDFLGYLRRSGVWLYDLAPTPVNRLRGRPRRDAVRERGAELIDILRRDQPRLVIAVKRDLEPVVRTAATEAGLPEDRVHVLPFPLYQWRAVYIQELASLLAGVGPTARQLPAGGRRPTP
jgi:hypothetical protein